MIKLLILLYVFGLLTYLVLEPKAKTSRIVAFPLLIGIGINSLIFLILGYMEIVYTKTLFLIINYLLMAIFIALIYIRRKELSITHDLKKIPIYYVLFLAFFVYRFVLLAHSSFVNFNNWDELRMYQYVSREILVFGTPNFLYSLFAPMSYFLGTMVYQFTDFSINNPRIFGGIFYGLISLFIYSELKNKNVNRHIAALLAMIFLISSGENFLYYITFYNNVFYAVFILIGFYLYYEYKNSKEKNLRSFILAFIFLVGAALTRRESSFHIIGVIGVYNLYLIIRKKAKLKDLIIELLPFIIIILTFSLFGRMNASHIPSLRPSKYSSQINESLFKTLTERLNWNDLQQNFKNSQHSMFMKSFAAYNGTMFLTAIIATVLSLVILITRKKNKYLGVGLFCAFQQFVYYGVVLFTALTLFNYNEYVGAASFTRYMMQVLPMSFITLGLILYGHEVEEKKRPERQSKITEKSKIIFVIPAYNEEKSIKKTYESIVAYNKKHKTKFDVIVINDGSTDSTKKVLEEEKIPHINLVCNLGIGGAVQTGYKYAYEHDYDVAIQFDGDGQHDIEYIDRLLKPLQNDEADMVIGSRFVEKDKQGFKSSLFRRLGIKLISFVIKRETNVKIYDTTSGFRAINRNILKIYCNKYPTEYPEPISSVNIIKKGYVIKEVPVRMKERKAGVSSIKPWKSAYYMVNVILTILVMGDD